MNPKSFNLETENNQPLPIQPLPNRPLSKRKKIIISIVSIVFLLALALGLGLGFSLKQKDNSSTAPIFGFLSQDIYDPQVMNISNVLFYGVRDFAGNLQSIYGVQVQDTTILFNDNRISLIHTPNETIMFSYNGSSYQAFFITKNHSLQLGSYSFQNITFPNISVSNDFDESYDPFKGVMVSLKDTISGAKLYDSIIYANYLDSLIGFRSVLMLSTGDGSYFLPMKGNTTQRILQKSSISSQDQNKNLQNSILLQLEPFGNLLKSYNIDDICSQLFSSISCPQIKSQISHIIPNSLSLAKNKVSQLPIIESSIVYNQNIVFNVRIPGEDSQNLFSYFDASNISDIGLSNFCSLSLTTEKAYCNDETVAGADTPDNRYINMGQTNITIKFHYQTYSVKDAIQVFHEEKEIFSSGCVGTGDEQISRLSIQGKDTNINVLVTPNCEGTTGTAWYYTIECPNSKIICKDGHCYCYQNLLLTQVKTPKSDGCGSKFLYNFIYQLGEKYGFTDVCNTHDICYGTCNVYKSNCDASFCSGLLDLCSKQSLKSCITFAKLFCSAVKNFGGSGFVDAQNEYCGCQ